MCTPPTPPPTPPPPPPDGKPTLHNCWQVTGPPGCGKTSWVVKNALLAAEKYTGEKLMVASLTRAAAYEFKIRGLGIIPEEQLGTLHSICLAALGRPELYEKHRAEWRAFTTEEGQANFALSPKRSRSDVEEEQNEGEALLNELTVLRNQNPLIRVRLNDLHGKLRRFYQLWETWKNETDYVDFTDLLEQCLEHVERAPGDPRVMFGDEAQDWSKLEVLLFRDKWGQHADKVILVGDPDQAIFEWRGADPRIFLDHPVPEEQKILLDQSYRVPGDVRDVALAWIRFEVDDREDVEYKSRPERGCVLRVDAGYKTPDELGPIFEEIQASEETCMVLGSCNYILWPTIRLLRDMGMPYANPYRSEEKAWNPLRLGGPGRFGGKSETTRLDRLLAYLAGSRELRGSQISEWTWKDLQLWCSPLRAKGDDAVLSHGTKAHLNTCVKENSPADPNHLDRFAEMFVGGWKGPHAERALRVDLVWWVSAMLEKEHSAFSYLVNLIAKRGQRALVEKPRIWPGTIHSVKGGQADTVIVFPDISPAASQQDGNETARLFYVAMTRAYKRLIICSPESVHHAKIYRTSTSTECEVPF